MYWKIEPFESHDADYCVMPAENEANHRAALEYAQERLEYGWDQLKYGEKFIVTIELCDGDLPEDSDN